MKFSQQVKSHPFPYFLLAWCVFNLLQATFSSLDPDEAYYWMYAQALDWGYFDHPPLVAISIALGSSWLPGSLGLRLGHVLLSGLTLAGIWDLVGRPRAEAAILLALILAAQPVFHLYGFIATPDGPLLFGAVAFWWAYRRFRDRPSPGNALLWGGMMALLLYAKYHGILLIVCTLLADWRLWRQPRFYLASAFGALLFLPHLYWQYSHDFPTFRYHLSGRNDPYELKFTLEFLLSQLFLFNPLLWWYYLRLRRPAWLSFAAILWINLIGIFLFFLWNTFKGPAEPHWTAVLAIPLSILLFQQARQQPRWSRGLSRLCIIGAVLLLLLRLGFLLPADRLPRGLQRQFNHQWTQAVADYAGSLPVLFENSYRRAAIYQFYSGKPGWTYTNTHYRPNQYDLWQADTLLHNQPLIMVGHIEWPCGEGCDTLAVPPQRMAAMHVDSFQQAKRMRFEILTDLPDQLARQAKLELKVRWTNPYSHAIVPAAGSLPLRLFAISRNGREPWVYWPVEWPDRPRVFPPYASGDFTIELQLPAGLHAGPAELRFGWAYGTMAPIREQGEVAHFNLQ